MKRIILSVIVCTALLISMSANKMDDNGKAGFTGAPGELDCTDCHDTYTLNSGGGSVNLTSTNMINWVYDPGVTYHMIATVARPTNELFGICVEALLPTGANAGTLIISNSTLTQIKTKTVSGNLRRSVVHKLDAGQGVDSFAFEFDWIAPGTNVGDVTFYFAGNATNGDGEPEFDYIYISSKVCEYNLSNDINTLNNLPPISVYPVPVNDNFNVNYVLPAKGIVNIKLYSMDGKMISLLSSKIMTAGQYSENFYLPSRLKPGNYLLSIESAGRVNTCKILIN